ncbi:hypothetical protein THAOC_23675, partial [Thalassiosira oceanica]
MKQSGAASTSRDKTIDCTGQYEGDQQTLSRLGAEDCAAAARGDTASHCAARRRHQSAAAAEAEPSPEPPPVGEGGRARQRPGA